MPEPIESYAARLAAAACALTASVPDGSVGPATRRELVGDRRVTAHGCPRG